MTTIETGNERLLRLAAFLEKLPPEHFDIRYYARSPDYSNLYEGLKSIISSPERPDLCGTVACAIGWCPILFPEHWEYRGFWPYLKDGEDDVSQSGIDFFQILEDDYRDLFMPSSYEKCKTTPTEVAERIRKLVANRI